MARPFARTLALVLALPALGTLTQAQNAFRPLPLPSDWGRWGSALESDAGGAFESLDALAAEPDERTFVEARAHGYFTGSGSLEGGGDVSTQSGGWSVTFGRELGEERLAAFSVETNGYFYDLGPGTVLVPGSSQPFNDLYEARFSGVVRTRGDGLGWFAGLSATLGGEDEADAGESLAIGGIGGFRWSRSPGTAIEFGIAAQSRLEDDAWLWPFLGFEWQANDRLSFEARGTSLQANVDWNDRWRTFARAEYLLHQFRLNDDAPLAAGVLRDETIRAGLGIVRRGEDVSFELYGGFDLWRELSTLDEGGAAVAEAEVDAAPFLAFSLVFDF